MEGSLNQAAIAEVLRKFLAETDEAKRPPIIATIFRVYRLAVKDELMAALDAELNAWLTDGQEREHLAIERPEGSA